MTKKQYWEIVSLAKDITDSTVTPAPPIGEQYCHILRSLFGDQREAMGIANELTRSSGVPHTAIAVTQGKIGEGILRSVDVHTIAANDVNILVLEIDKVQSSLNNISQGGAVLIKARTLPHEQVLLNQYPWFCADGIVLKNVRIEKRRRHLMLTGSWEDMSLGSPFIQV